MDMRYFNYFIEFIIFLSLVLYAFETVPNLQPNIKHLLKISEIVVVLIFSIEYIIRLIHGKMKYVLSFFGIIDLLSVVPFFIFFIPQISLLKILRLARIIKLIRYGKVSSRLFDAIKSVKKELIVFTVINFCMLYIVSVLMYYIEGPAQPDKFGSIIQSFYWAVITLTTIGYGDVVPITIGGKILTGVIAVLGIGVITIPTGLIASSLMKARKSEKQIIETDPHLETIPNNTLPINEGGNPEIEEPGKLSGLE